VCVGGGAQALPRVRLPRRWRWSPRASRRCASPRSASRSCRCSSCRSAPRSWTLKRPILRRRMYDQIPHFFHEFNFVNAEVGSQKLILTNRSGAWNQFNGEKITAIVRVEELFLSHRPSRSRRWDPGGPADSQRVFFWKHPQPLASDTWPHMGLRPSIKPR